jgi:hypothetical protein
MRARQCAGHLASAGLHLLTALIVFRAAAAVAPALVTPAQAADPMVVFVPPEVSATRPDTTPEDLGIHLDGKATQLDLPGFSFDLDKIAKRSTALFPFLSPKLSFERVAPASSRTRAHGLVNPFAPHRVDVEGSPLALTPAAMQSLLDKSWSRRDRWRIFQPMSRLMNGYNPDEGSLPALVRGYVAQNGLQPYIDGASKDPRLWAQLGLAADHADFVDFISRYAAQHPSTKVTTELLFLMEQMVQASFDTLTTLLDTDAAQLEGTRQANRDAFNTLDAIRRFYRAQLEARAITSREALRTYFEEARLSILTSILRTTPGGYRESDARFLMGAVYWRQGKAADAEAVWSAMTDDPSDAYVVTYSEILAAIRAKQGRRLDVKNDSRIHIALNAQRGQWISFSYERLRQFGYHFDTY